MRYAFDCHILSQSSQRPMIDEVIQTEPMLRFTLDYPLREPRSFAVDHGTAWTERQFIDAIRRAYEAAFAEVGSDIHGLSDLYLEGAERNHDGTWTLDIGS